MASDKVSTPIQEARRIHGDNIDKPIGARIVVPVLDTEEFWQGINLLTISDYKLIPGTNPCIVTLERVRL